METKSVRASKVFRPPYTDHERRVRTMMIGFGQDTPDMPTVGSEKTRITRVRLDLEEVLEFAGDAAISVRYTHPSATLEDARLLDLLLSGNAVLSNEERKEAKTLCDTIRNYLQHQPLIKFDEDGGNVAIAGIPGKVPDLAKMIDACSDMSVVNTGAFVAFGVIMTSMLELTDENNLMKIANGKLDENGKFRKSPTHPVPNYEFALSVQGYDPDRDPHLISIHDAHLPQPIDRDNGVFAKAEQYRTAPKSTEPAEPAEPPEPEEELRQPMAAPRGSLANNHSVRLGQRSEERIYSGGMVDAIHSMLMDKRLSEASTKLVEVHHYAGASIPAGKMPAPLRMTGPGDSGPRGVVFHYC